MREIHRHVAETGLRKLLENDLADSLLMLRIDEGIQQHYHEAADTLINQVFHFGANVVVTRWYEDVTEIVDPFLNTHNEMAWHDWQRTLRASAIVPLGQFEAVRPILCTPHTD